MVVEDLLRGEIETVYSNDDLMLALERKASSSRTSKMCIENFIKPVLIMMLFVRGEREADWAFHIWAVNKMILYFFAAGHVKYARYGLYYLRTMVCLPTEVLTRFLKGEHVMHHQSGFSTWPWRTFWYYSFSCQKMGFESSHLQSAH